MIIHLFTPIPENINEEYINKLNELKEIEDKFPLKEITDFQELIKG